MAIALLVVAYLIIGIIFSVIFSIYHRKFDYYNDEEGPFVVFGFIVAWPVMMTLFLIRELCESIWNLGYKIRKKKKKDDDP